MGIISVSLPSDGQTADAADVNTPINTIVNEFNGNIDNANIKSAAAIATSKIAADGGLTRASLQYGLVRQRQGGTTGDATYWTSGTSNTDTSGKALFMQAGSIGTSSGGDTTITFPTAFSFVPLILVSVNGGNAGTGGVTQNCFAEVVSKTTTTAVIRTFNTSGGQSDQNVAWLAIGQ